MQWFHVWYMRPEFFRDGMLGHDVLQDRGKLPDAANLTKTHVYLLPMMAANKEQLFQQMQGENWSPMGEARPLIESLGLQHTSMSVGDVVVDLNGAAWFVDRFGFKQIHPPLDDMLNRVRAYRRQGMSLRDAVDKVRAENAEQEKETAPMKK